MKKKYILPICLLIAFLAIAFAIREFNNIIIRVRNDSGLGCAQWEIRDALKEYYNKNGKYPAKLTELPNLVFQDEAFSGMKKADSNELLKNFTYKATDTTYELDTDYSRATEPRMRKEFGEKGQIVAFEYCYVGSNLRERYEYPNGLHKNPEIRKRYRNNELISETNDPNCFESVSFN
jgi:hypothetical protein